MSPADTGLLLIDMQEKLVPLVNNNERIVWNVRRLLDAAKILNVAVLATEQYPKGLGSTIPALAPGLGQVPSKLAFSCAGCSEIQEGLQSKGLNKVLLCGIEAHVCVQQTALDLMAEGYRVYVAADAIGSRNSLDYEIALRRMDSAGATLTTTESALFEWCGAAGTPEFKAISALVRQSQP